jgi:O-antigen ligase
MKTIQKKYYNNFLFFLIILFPVFPLLGRVSAEVGIFFIIIIFLYEVFKSKNYIVFKNFYFYYFLFFYLYFLIRTLIYSLEFDDFRAALFYIRFGLFFLALSYFLNRLSLNKNYLIIISFFFIFLILDSTMQYYYGTNIIGIEPHNGRATSFFGKSLRLGSYLLRFLPFILIIILLYEIDLKKNRFYLSLLFAFYAHTIFLTAERTSIFLLILMVLLFFLLLNKFRIILILSLFFFILIVSFNNLFLEKKPYDRLLFSTINQVIVKSKNNQDFEIKIFSKEHQGHYIVAWRMFLDNPLFGQGVNSFSELCYLEKFKKDDGICTTHPHNNYLQLLSEVGIIGFLFIFSIFFIISKLFFIKIFFREKNKVHLTKYQLIKYVSLIAIFINLWPFSPNGNFFNNWLSSMYYYPIGFYLFSMNK